MRHKYVVTISKSYVDMEFVFDSISDAGAFIEQALGAYRKEASDDEGDRNKIRVNIKIEEIEEA